MNLRLETDINSTNKQIKTGAIISYAAIIFNVVAGLIYTPWMVKQIGKSDYGLYTLAMSAISLFLMDFGISAAISRFISIYRAQGKEEKVQDLLGVTYKLYLIMDVIIFIILAIIYLFMKNIFVQLTASEIDKFRNVFCIVGLFSLVSFPFMPLNGILISYEKFVTLKFCELMQKLLSIGFVIIALLLGYGLYALVLINALLDIGIILFKFVYLKRKVHIKSNFNYHNSGLLKQLFGFSVWMTVMSIAQRLIINISPSFLGIFSGAIQISIFSIGISLEGYIWTFANAFNGLFLPKVTRIVIQKQEIDHITNLMIKVGRIQLEVVGVLFVGLFLMGKEFICLWMGNDFINSYYVALFLILPGVVTLTQEIAYNYLVAINEIKYRAYDYIGTAIISVFLSIVLTPRYGAIGAAISAGIGIFAGHVVAMNIIYYKVFKIDIPRFFKECHLKLALPLILSGVVAFLIQEFFPVSHLIHFFIKAIVVSSCYIVFMWLFGFNDYEKNLFSSGFISFRKRIIKR